MSKITKRKCFNCDNQLPSFLNKKVNFCSDCCKNLHNTIKLYKFHKPAQKSKKVIEIINELFNLNFELEDMKYSPSAFNSVVIDETYFSLRYITSPYTMQQIIDAYKKNLKIVLSKYNEIIIYDNENNPLPLKA